MFPQNGIELSVGVMMSISLEEKTKIIGEFAKKEGDTESPGSDCRADGGNPGDQ